MSNPLSNNPAAAWWTPRRFSAFLVVWLILGIAGVLDGLLWQHDWVLGGLSAVVLLGALALVGLCAKKQSWRWFLRPDHSTTKWQSQSPRNSAVKLNPAVSTVILTAATVSWVVSAVTAGLHGHTGKTIVGAVAAVLFGWLASMAYRRWQRAKLPGGGFDGPGL